ncbi:MAG: ABC transporter permease [Lachnospiraceae bacterium]|nr:ABC transporter permease [Lachnospiraceae bacterium]
MKKYIEGFMRYRFLLVELIKKGIKLKYRRSYLGLIWTLLEPLMTSMVLAFVFGKMLQRGGSVQSYYPFTIYILAGRLVYGCFSSCTKIAMKSIRANQAMIKKVYVPKYLYPLSTVLYNYILFLLSLIVLAIMMIFYTITDKSYTMVINLNTLQIILPLATLFIACVGAGLILSTVCVFFRDLEYLWDVILMLVMYCSGVFYFVDKNMGEAAHAIIKFNPLYCVISNLRTVIAGKSLFTTMDLYAGYSELKMLIYAFGLSVLSVIVGVYMFKKHQDNFILHI